MLSYSVDPGRPRPAAPPQGWHAAREYGDRNTVHNNDVCYPTVLIREDPGQQPHHKVGMQLESMETGIQYIIMMFVILQC